MPTFLSITGGQVEYATRTKIKELATEIAASYSLVKVKSQIKLAATLLRYLRALQADSSLTYEEKQAIYQCLIKKGKLYHFPTAPTVTATQVVNIIVGSQGPTGPQGPQGPPGTGFPYFANTDVDTAFEVVDLFAVGEANGCRWDYYAIGGGIGEGRRSGSVIAVWDNSAVEFSEYTTADLGGITTPVTFTVDISGGNVRLLANVTTDNWIIRGARYQMQDLI